MQPTNQNKRKANIDGVNNNNNNNNVDDSINNGVEKNVEVEDKKIKLCETGNDMDKKVCDNSLINDMDKYAIEVTLDDENDNDEHNNSYKEFMSLKNVNHSLYNHTAYDLINMPTNKYHAYQKLTKYIGYDYNKTNDFLCNGGIMNVLQQEVPFYCFWKHSLTIYLQSVVPNNFDVPVGRISPRIAEERSFENDRFPSIYKKNMQSCTNDRNSSGIVRRPNVNLLIKTSHCAEHEIQCPTNFGPDIKKCRIVRECITGDSFSYMMSGILKVNKIPFVSYSIELNNSRRIETREINVSNQINLKKVRNIYLMNKCKHDRCRVIENDIPFPGMQRIYNMCSEIERVDRIEKITYDYNSKECYIYGKSLYGNYHEPSRTVYMLTWAVDELYIVNY